MKNVRIMKSLLCLVLAILMMFSAVSCFGKKDEPQGTESNNANTDDPASGELSDEEFYKPEKKDYNRELTFMTDIPAFMGVNENYKDGDGTVLDDAVYRRAQLMANEFGVDVVVKTGTEAEYSTYVTTGQYACDCLVMMAQSTFRLVLQDLMVDLATLNNLNLQAPYWDQRIQTDYAVGDRIFCLEGDFSYYDEYRTMTVLFNDKLYTDYGYYETYGSPYSLVKNGTWTMDNMLTMADGLYRDLNDDGHRDEFDQYGIIGALNIQWNFFLASGLKTIEVKDGELTLNIKSDGYYNQVYDVFDNVMTKFTGDDDIIYPHHLHDLSTDKWAAASNIFENNQALFRMTTLSAASRLGNMATKFGVLPFPAYTEGGDYYGWLPGDSHNPLSMARTVENREETAAILDAFCYYSRYGANTLYDAYFESFRISKFCENEEDLEMMNLVIETKCYDLDFVANITGFSSEIWSMARNENISTLASTLTAKRNSASGAMDEFILRIMSLG